MKTIYEQHLDEWIYYEIFRNTRQHGEVSGYGVQEGVVKSRGLEPPSLLSGLVSVF